jgi:hypothetical protein
VADARALVDGDAEAEPPTPPTPVPPDADALADGDALLDGDADVLAEVLGDDEPVAPDADGAGDAVVGLPHAASTPSTSTNNMIKEKRCFIGSAHS